MQLSHRMQSVADLVTPGECLADIGTDHGYIPIEMVRTGRTKRAIAMDVKEGPLKRAVENIHRADLEEKIEIRLSDGAKGLKPYEADRAVIAGMGGALYAHNYSSLAATSAKFGYNMSIMFLVYVVLGGIGNIRGSVIAATILYILPELLRSMQKYRMLIYAIVLIAVMLFSWSPAARQFRERYSLKRLFKKNTEKEDA